MNKIKTFTISYVLPLIVIFLILEIGKIISKFIPVLPGSIIGMLLLFLLLILNIIPYNFIKDFSSLVIKHMSFFLIPAGISILTTLKVIDGYVLQILTILILVFLLTFSSVVGIISLILKKKES